MRVIDGRLTRSMSAISLGVSGPERLIVASAETAVGVIPPVSSARLLAQPAGVRTIAFRRWEAVSASEVSEALVAIEVSVGN